MRQQNNDMGRVERQVTARPSATYNAPQTQAIVDQRANRFADGLSSFVDVMGQARQQKQAKARDAQALTADLGLRNFQQAFNAAWETDPSIRDNDEKRMQWVEDHRQRYFGDVEDPDILGKVNQRVDSFLQGTLDTYAFQKAAEQRLELGSQSMLQSMEQVQAAITSGQIDLEGGVKELRGFFDALSNSESFNFTPEQRESVIRTLAEGTGKEGAILLGAAYGNDDSLSVGTQLWLRAKSEEAQAMTAIEKEQIRSQAFRQWDSLIDQGALRWETMQPYVDQGIITATQQRDLMRRQQTRLEKKVKDVSFQNNVVTAFMRNPDHVNPRELAALRLENPSEYRKTVQSIRSHFEEQGEMDTFFRIMTAAGEQDPLTQDLVERAFASSNRLVSADEEIPPFMAGLMDNELESMWRSNSLFSILKPDTAYRVAVMKAGTDLLGMDKRDAYNLSLGDSYERMLDIPRPQMLEFQSRVAREGMGLAGTNWLRSNTWQIDGTSPQGIVGALSAVALQLVNSGRYSDEEAISWVRNQVKQSMIGTDHGPVPRTIFGAYASDEDVRNRVNYFGRQQAEANGFKPSDISMRFTNDGRVLLFSPGDVSPIGSTHIQNIQAPANVEVGGVPSIQRQLDDDTRETQIRRAGRGAEARKDADSWQNSTSPTARGPYGF